MIKCVSFDLQGTITDAELEKGLAILSDAFANA